VGASMRPRLVRQVKNEVDGDNLVLRSPRAAAPRPGNKGYRRAAQNQLRAVDADPYSDIWRS